MAIVWSLASRTGHSAVPHRSRPAWPAGGVVLVRRCDVGVGDLVDDALVLLVQPGDELPDVLGPRALADERHLAVPLPEGRHEPALALEQRGRDDLGREEQRLLGAAGGEGQRHRGHGEAIEEVPPTTAKAEPGAEGDPEHGSLRIPPAYVTPAYRFIARAIAAILSAKFTWLSSSGA